jgi:hypothetical protein
MTTCHYCRQVIDRDEDYWSSWQSEEDGDHCLSSPDGWHYRAFSPVWGERQADEMPRGQLRLFRAIVGERTESYGINGHKYEREVTYVREPGTYGPDDDGRTDTRVIGHAYPCGACEEGEPEPDW